MRDVFELLQERHLDRNNEVLLATVSGVASTKPALIRYFDTEIPAVDIITTKSFQVLPNPGNREPIICETEAGVYGNSVGLRNPGLEVALAELIALREEHDFRALINVSLSANTIEDFITLVKAFDPVADLVELNFSCPHVSSGYGAAIGCDPNIAAEYVRTIKAATEECQAPLFIKLTPNVDDIGSIAREVVAAGADGLVAINTVGPILHIDPVSGTPILQNDLGGKGGLSGRPVYADALQAVADIRRAVGPSIPLIGMGGVFSGKEAAALIAAGADAVGVGSALGSVDQRNWGPYLAAIQAEAEASLSECDSNADSSVYLATERQMAYERHTVTKVEHHGTSTAIITLNGSVDCKAGQFAFLWIPQVGEKPFSVATNDPLTFVVKDRGPFSKALCALEEGDALYVRGLYGAEVENVATKAALLLGGGTGVAVLPSLAEKLHSEGTELTILVGSSEERSEEPLLAKELSAYGAFQCIYDEGRPGRVLALLDEVPLADDQAAYLVGPEVFMALAAKQLLARGIPEDRIYLSMELMTLCGIGMCGECACGDRLTCRWGTFMTYEYIRAEAPELLAYD